MSPLAFPNVQGNLFTLSEEDLQRGLNASRESSRLRMILPVHREQEAEVQRLVNFLQPGTYIRPHLHPRNHASESIVLLRGAIRFFTFDDNGEILSDHVLTSSPLPAVLDIEPGVWHTFLVLEEDTILFECKKGPYDKKADKTFAPWAPEEGSIKAKDWMGRLSGH
jgi:cupin fold WbuC family metalloprotein